MPLVKVLDYRHNQWKEFMNILDGEEIYINKNRKYMAKVQVWMYPDDETANAELVRFISLNKIVDTQWTDFWNDRDMIDFRFFGMDDPGQWFGGMMGVQLTTEDGLCVIFASWITEEYRKEFGEYFNRVMDAFTLMTKPSDMKL